MSEKMSVSQKKENVEKGSEPNTHWNPLRGVSSEVSQALGKGSPEMQSATTAMVLEAIFSGTFDGGHVTSISHDLISRGWGESESHVIAPWILEKRKEFLKNYGLEVDPNNL